MHHINCDLACARIIIEERGGIVASIHVLVADDSALYRRIVTKAVEAAAPGALVEYATNGMEVLTALQNSSFDLVLMDVSMPVKDGLETLSELKPLYPNLPVVIISGVSLKSADLALMALDRGALDFIAKPQAGSIDVQIDKIAAPLRALLQHIRTRSVQLSVYDRLKARSPQESIRPLRPSLLTETGLKPMSVPSVLGSPGLNNVTASMRGAQHWDTMDLVMIAASTGGPAALERVLCRLPATFNKPILVVQHMPDGFTKALADKMNSHSAIRIAEAADGSLMRPGLALVAPGGMHMTARRSKLVRLNSSDYVNGVRPSADVLFRSVAEEYAGGKILTVVLTGMGSDGMEGIRELKRTTRCYTITQSETSCVVYGMPRSVVEAKLSDEVVALDLIASRIDDIVRRGV